MTIDKDKIEKILEEWTSKQISIQAAVLVSSESQLITKAIGMDEDSVQIVAGTLLYLTERTREELKWQEIEQISVRAKEGYIFLANCREDVFLLVKTNKAPAGLLEGEINRTIRKLQAEVPELKTETSAEVNPLWQEGN